MKRQLQKKIASQRLRVDYKRLPHVALLGSTGSIGRQVLDFLGTYKDHYVVAALTAHSSHELLQEQCKQFPNARSVITSQYPDAKDRQRLLVDSAIDERNTIIINALSGIGGVQPTIAAIGAGKIVVLANKESLVVAGEKIMEEARKTGARIIPLDSEASSIWRLLRCEHATDCKEIHDSVVADLCPKKINKVKHIIITASGGPFFGFSKEQLRHVTPEQARSHPTWNMGKKITVDSATLMNKAFEVIECARLFGIASEKITVVINRTSNVHALIEFIDGHIEAVMYPPDMRFPIADSLSRLNPNVLISEYISHLPTMGFTDLRINFQDIDTALFPAVALARDALARGEIACARLCEANETAVQAFLRNEIAFNEIYPFIFRLYELRPHSRSRLKYPLRQRQTLCTPLE